jgi:hypothetical protein
MSSVIPVWLGLLLLIGLAYECKRPGRQVLAAFCAAGVVAAFPAVHEKLTALLSWVGTIVHVFR